MTPRIALLRAVNVGGTGKLAMAELKALADDLGLAQARTLLNSGNLVFGSDRADADLEGLLEAEAKARLGVATDVMVRNLAAWSAMIAANPFPDEAAGDPGRLIVFFFKAPPAPETFDALVEANPGRERLALEGREMFVHFPDGSGESKLNPLIPRILKVAGTGRNWNTVGKLAELAAGLGR